MDIETPGEFRPGGQFDFGARKRQLAEILHAAGGLTTRTVDFGRGAIAEPSHTPLDA